MARYHSLTRAQVIEIVTESEAAYAARATRNAAAAEATYARYHGVANVFPAKPGSPRMAGYCTNIGGFVGQEEWHAACDLRDATARVRCGADAAWLATTRDGLMVFRYRFETDLNVGSMGGGVELEIPTHGVDVSNCRTPTEAIARVRAAHGLAD